jgi:HAD superfamily hydrolase (TIGR01509 family)
MKAPIFDLDGTLVDTVYAHALAWQAALAEYGIETDAARLHRRIGMAGDLLVQEVARDNGTKLSPAKSKSANERHGELFARLAPKPRPLDGAVELLRKLRQRRVPHGIATSGERDSIRPAIAALKLPAGAIVVDGTSAHQAKPAPDLFIQCQRRLRAPEKDCFVIGDATWDVLAARRAGMLAVGLLSGGYGEDELYRAGAFRVYRDAGELLGSIGHLGLSL